MTVVEQDLIVTQEYTAVYVPVGSKFIDMTDEGDRLIHTRWHNIKESVDATAEIDGYYQMDRYLIRHGDHPPEMPTPYIGLSELSHAKVIGFLTYPSSLYVLPVILVKMGIEPVAKFSANEYTHRMFESPTANEGYWVDS